MIINKVIFLMSELRKLYGQFQILKKNKDQGFNKLTYSSLDKYNKSPYLQRVVQHINKKTPNNKQTTPADIQHDKLQTIDPHLDQKQQSPKPKHNYSHQLPKIGHIKHKQQILITPFKTELESVDTTLLNEKSSTGTHSSNLQANHIKKNKLQPIQQTRKLHYVTKTKAGTTGKQSKINQDIAFADVRLPFGLQMFCVCDGHGLNGHLVSSYIKTNFIKTLNVLMKTKTSAPSLEQMKQIISKVFTMTNQSLLGCQINTQLSGSTVVAVFIYAKKIICYNVGDSRAILVKQLLKQLNTQQNSIQYQQVQSKNTMDGFISRIAGNCDWKVVSLSNDQKPGRPDQQQRIIQSGGRVFAQKNEKGQVIGPLRVWMKDAQMPGLAMTRSFGDKAGIKAGTNGQPQIMEFDLTEEDKFMVVASDGLWEYLQNDDVMGLMIPYYLKDDLQMGAQRLIKISCEIWQKISLSRDDITVILIGLNSPSEEGQ